MNVSVRDIQVALVAQQTHTVFYYHPVATLRFELGISPALRRFFLENLFESLLVHGQDDFYVVVTQLFGAETVLVNAETVVVGLNLLVD